MPHKRRVLVVDDDLDTANTTVTLLRTVGYEVASAINAFSAIATARTFRPDVVLLDLGLPDCNGWSVARQLRRERDLAEVRIVAVSGRTGEDDRQRSWNVGCVKHLLKPVSLAVLQEVIEGACALDEKEDREWRSGRDSNPRPPA